MTLVLPGFFLPLGTGGSQQLQFKNFKFDSKIEKWKKIPKNTSRCVESNGVKKFQILVHLVFFWALEVQPKKKKKKLAS